jgi:hypothetical protein
MQLDLEFAILFLLYVLVVPIGSCAFLGWIIGCSSVGLIRAKHRYSNRYTQDFDRNNVGSSYAAPSLDADGFSPLLRTEIPVESDLATED